MRILNNPNQLDLPIVIHVGSGRHYGRTGRPIRTYSGGKDVVDLLDGDVTRHIPQNNCILLRFCDGLDGRPVIDNCHGLALICWIGWFGSTSCVKSHRSLPYLAGYDRLLDELQVCGYLKHRRSLREVEIVIVAATEYDSSDYRQNIIDKNLLRWTSNIFEVGTYLIRFL